MADVFQKALADPVAFATLILAALTAALALITVAAIIVPLVVARRELDSRRRAVRRRTAVLLDGLQGLLNEQMREPAWLLSRTAQTLADAALSDDVLAHLAPNAAKAVTEAVVLAHRSLTAEDRVLEARRTQNVGMFDEIRSSAREAAAYVQVARQQVSVEASP